jgi:putative phosphoesterase
MATIGLIADTHDDLVAWGDIQPKVAAAFAGVDLIVHCGDLTTMAVLDSLGEIAPVVAVRSPGDPPADGTRLFDGPHLIEHAGTAIAVLNALGEQTFDEIAVVLHGGTHQASVEHRANRLVVNPGSPSLAETVTVALVEIDGGRVEAAIVPL